MKLPPRKLVFLGSVIKALRLALPKLGIGWMFALLTSNFNRIAIYELGIAAVLIAVLISIHHVLSPFQVIFGRLADQHPIFGLRRTPFFLLGSLVASLVFIALPSVTLAMSSGSIGGISICIALFMLFGLGIAASGDAHHALIVDVTTERVRGAVIALVWSFTIVSAIVSAGVIKVMLPAYNQAAMQSLYNLTPLVVMGSALLGVVGLERRLSRQQLAAARVGSYGSPQGNPVSVALRVLRENLQARAFFAFVFLAILGIFMQDAILEVFGAEAFGMTLSETTTFQQTWGGGLLLGMIIMGLATLVVPVSKKLIATVGSCGTALGLGILTLTALTGQRALLNPALILMGLSTGLFNIGALSLMMDMTVEGATGLYMGLWGMAQAFGTALASIISGGLKSALIETGLLSVSMGYTAIFGLETIVMVISIAVLQGVSVEAFRGLTRSDLRRTMELETLAQS